MVSLIHQIKGFQLLTDNVDYHRGVGIYKVPTVWAADITYVMFACPFLFSKRGPYKRKETLKWDLKQTSKLHRSAK